MTFIASVSIASCFLFLAGLVKGAIGAGAPVIAVPALVMLFDVKTGVILMLGSNLFVNIWQVWQFRGSVVSWKFAATFAGAGGAGAAVGSWLLAYLSGELLQLVVAFGVLVFIGFRVLRPQWGLADTVALRLAAPLGLIAGILQGTSGISAPVSISFLNAMRLERPAFIATISIFFISMTLVQIPSLIVLGLMTKELFAASLLALVPIAAGLPVGRMLIQRFSKEFFDRIILAFLLLLAVKLIFDAIKHF